MSKGRRPLRALAALGSAALLAGLLGLGCAGVAAGLGLLGVRTVERSPWDGRSCLVQRQAVMAVTWDCCGAASLVDACPPLDEGVVGRISDGDPGVACSSVQARQAAYWSARSCCLESFGVPVGWEEATAFYVAPRCLGL